MRLHLSGWATRLPWNRISIALLLTSLSLLAFGDQPTYSPAPHTGGIVIMENISPERLFSEGSQDENAPWTCVEVRNPSGSLVASFHCSDPGLSVPIAIPSGRYLVKRTNSRGYEEWYEIYHP